MNEMIKENRRIELEEQGKLPNSPCRVGAYYKETFRRRKDDQPKRDSLVYHHVTGIYEAPWGKTMFLTDQFTITVNKGKVCRAWIYQDMPEHLRPLWDGMEYREVSQEEYEEVLNVALAHLQKDLQISPVKMLWRRWFGQKDFEPILDMYTEYKEN